MHPAPFLILECARLAAALGWALGRYLTVCKSNRTLRLMTVNQILKAIDELPAAERAKVVAHILDDDSWIPESFKRAMEQIESGRTYPMELVMSGAPPPAE
jgi:hypothetical protein